MSPRFHTPLLLATTITFAATRPAEACTAFALPAYGVVAKSYDWHVSEGFLLVNPRGVEKRALLLSPTLRAARWVSRFGSVTFNQYGHSFPNGGMNEKGLVVEILWLDATQYAPVGRDQTAVNELQWIQLLLDRAATIDEAIALARRHGIAPVHAKVHYLVCDAASRCATFEHLGAKLVIHHGATLPVPALTNHRYARSLAYWRKRGARSGSGSLPRFTRAADAARRATARVPGVDPIHNAFATLASVRSGSYSKWQIVYDQRRKVVRYRPAGATRTALRVAFADLRFDCSAPARFADLTGAVSREPGLQRFTPAHNQRLVQLTLGRLGLPAPLQGVVAAYPSSLRCVGHAPGQAKPRGHTRRHERLIPTPPRRDIIGAS